MHIILMDLRKKEDTAARTGFFWPMTGTTGLLWRNNATNLQDSIKY
jgi:hypothetical protein